MTERGAGRISRDDSSLVIGPSSIRRDQHGLTLQFDETCAPLPKPVRGRVRIFCDQLEQIEYALDPQSLHRWRPLAPQARIEVDLDRPALQWRGGCYVDSNSGDEPLETRFESWNWARAHSSRGAAIIYDAIRRDGGNTSLALLFDGTGSHRFDAPPMVSLPRTGWLLDRSTRADAGFKPSIVEEFEDAPFYSRSLLRTRLMGEDAFAVHESLSLDRFRSPWIQWMLPFRMPRWR